MTAPWLLLQLADGTFPSGGFSHSAGLEATMVLGGLGEDEGALGRFFVASLHQVGRAALPFVRAAATAPSQLPEIDDHYDATIPMQAIERASRAQGRALANAASRVWETLAPISEYVRRGPAHHAPVFGAVFGTLGVGPDETLSAYLHGVARGILSAAVRLGITGPLEAQRLHASRASSMDAIVRGARHVDPSNAAQTAPLLEIFGALHDRLDGRVFQS